MHATPLASLHKLVWTALLAALLAAGAFLHVPLGPVPISLQTMFVLLCGFVLGPWRGLLAVGLYLLAGFAGLPVFSGGASGLAHFLGPTGGYMIGFLPCAAIAGLAVRNVEKQGRAPSLASLAGYGALGLLAVYALGVPRLAMILNVGLGKAFGVGMLPFLPGAALKLAGACVAARFLHKKGLLAR